MAKVKITNATLIDGKHVEPGKVVDVEGRTARTLFASNKAVPFAGEPEKPTAKTPEETATKSKTSKKSK